MRTLIGIPLLLLPLAAVQAQDKGFISGTIGFSSTKVDPPGSSDDETTNTFTFGPAIGINLDASNVVGLALNATTSKRTYQVGERDAADKENLFEVAPFYRYVKSVGDKFSLYGQAQVGLGFGKRTSDIDGVSPDTETKISTFRVGVGPGILFVPATRWALSADWGLIGYRTRTEKVELDDRDVRTTTSGFDAKLDLARITLALNWLF